MKQITFSLPRCRLAVASLSLLMLCAMAPMMSVSQTVECHTPDLTPEQYAKKREDFFRYQAESASNQQRGSTITDIPVYFHIRRLGNGGIPSKMLRGGHPVTQAQMNAAIAALNTAYGRADLRFYQLGRINELDCDVFDATSSDWEYEKYSYVSTALNIYLNYAGNAGTQPAQASNLFELGIVRLNNIATEVNTFVHETGHTFGLLHTFGQTPAYNYPVRYDRNNPTNVAAMQVDHPYNYGPGGTPRELAIRNFTGGKEFENPNCDRAGDLCCDTEAECMAAGFAFPAVIPDANGQVQLNCGIPNAACQSSCAGCGNPGAYKDYNLDPVVGNPSNPMSSPSCGLNTTDCQIEQVKQAFTDYNMADKYRALPINVDSRVTNKDGPGLSKVHIDWTFNGPMIFPLKCASFTNSSGQFQAIVDGLVLSAKIRRLGSDYRVAGGTAAGSIYEDVYTRADWEEGVNVCDLIALRRHVYGTRKLQTGWQKLAGDVDGNNSLTPLDPVTLNTFLLGYSKTLLAFQEPWRFVPKFIPEQNLGDFNNNPFLLNIDGIIRTSTVYTSSNFIYPTERARSGYGGFHVGDVVDGPCTSCKSDIEDLDIENQILAADKNYRIDLKVQDFQNVIAFQTGIKYDEELLEIKNVVSGSISEFDKYEHTNLAIMEDSLLKIIWVDSVAGNRTLANNSDLVSIYVRTKQPVVNLRSAFSIDKETFPTSIYTEESGCNANPDIHAEITEIFEAGERGNSNVPAEMSPFLCYPNPLSGDLNIAFESNIAEAGEIRIVDVNGQLIHRTEVNIQHGINTFLIPETALQSAPGLLTVTLRGAATNNSARLIKR